MTIKDLVDELNYYNSANKDDLSENELDALHELIEGMMLASCGEIAKFKLTNKGQIELENQNV